MTPTKWMYQGKQFNVEDIKQYKGFVYCITNMNNGMKYIGKKFFYATRTLPPLKGKTRKRRVTKMSNWISYTSSSKFVKSDVECGVEFKYEILGLYDNKTETNYAELRYLIVCDVLNPDNGYYNANIERVYFNSHKYNTKREDDFNRIIEWASQ